MSTEPNIHAGHRERMIKKFLINPNGLTDHEALEILLFFALPRINTNEIAHRLLNTFGSLEKVFSATHTQLKTVIGVGDRAATEILLVGSILRRLRSEQTKEVRLRNFGELKEYVENQFTNERTERFLLLLLDSKYKLLARYDFTDEQRTMVSADVPEFAELIALYKPKNVMLVHNHPSGNCFPSENDDTATAQVAMICSMHCVTLVDHVIVGDNIYSYRNSGKLERILEKANINNVTY